MDFEDYKTKIQKVSNILEHAKYPEDVLNSSDIQFESDFQYICLNSNINNELVNEVIARLAQNGNRAIVESNVKNISISMWKDLFNKNKVIREIFIGNFGRVIDNTGIVTYRDIENFINDSETQHTIYENIAVIIKKLCTYDRASLIASVKTKENGVETIKNNLEEFFQKGEYDISTTYSKILVELSEIPEITQAEILEACSKHLTEMLDRETAVDNETNVLLNWIYDSMEDAKMSAEKRADIQEDIDKAIMNNFDGILDKTNYDKETIKILKLFSCTHGKFSNTKNMFMENSSKLIHMTKIYDLNYEKENKNQEIKTEYAELKKEQQRNQEESIVDCGNIKQSNDLEEKMERAKNFIEDVKEEIETIEQYNDLIKKGSGQDNQADAILDALIKSNLYETDEIIDKVIKKERSVKFDDTTVWEAIKEENVEVHNNMDDTKEFINFDFGSTEKKEYVISKEKDQPKEVPLVAEIKQEEVNQKVAISDETQSFSFSRSVKDGEALITSDELTGINKVLNLVKCFFRKVKGAFAKYKTDRLGE